MCFQQYAKAMSLQTIAIDIGDDKKAVCESLGSSAFVDFATSTDVVKDVQAATQDGEGPHAVCWWLYRRSHFNRLQL
jgi:alcohol dehydrogenase, propanol-preferring